MTSMKKFILKQITHLCKYDVLRHGITYIFDVTKCTVLGTISMHQLFFKVKG